MRRAFDLGITNFDLANNYGPPYGSAEENFGRILATDSAYYRDELVVSTKAGWDMCGPPALRRLAHAELRGRRHRSASAASTASCSRPLVASALPCCGPGSPVIDVKRPPASSTMGMRAARS